MPRRKKSKFSPLIRQTQLSPLQKKVYEQIKLFRNKHDEGPTFKEVAMKVGKRVGTVHSALNGLRRRGLIIWGDRVPRSLDIVIERASGPSLAKVVHKEPEHAEAEEKPQARPQYDHLAIAKQSLEKIIEHARRELADMEEALRLLSKTS